MADLIKSGYIVTGGLNTNLIESSLFNLSIKGNLLPTKTNFYSLGSNLKKWKNLFLSNSIYLNGQEIKYDVANNRFEFEGDVKITNKLILSSDNKEIYYNTTDNKFIIDGNVQINGTLESDGGGSGGCGGVRFLDDILYVNKLYVVNELIATDILLIGNNTLIAPNTYILQINGDAYFSSVVRAAQFKALSDERLKTNVMTIENPIQTLQKIRGVTFNWKSDQKSSSGIIAQEVEKVIPEAVESNENDYKTVDYNCLIGYLIEGVKKNNETIRKQNETIRKQNETIRKLEEKMNSILNYLTMK